MNGRATSFGPFLLLAEERLLLEGDRPVRLGSRAFDILVSLIERAGEVVGSFGLDLDWDVLRSRMSSTTRPAPNLRGRCWRGVRARQIVRPGSER